MIKFHSIYDRWIEKVYAGRMQKLGLKLVLCQVEVV